MTKKRALITGVFGQDGSYLAEILTEKGYEVHGVEKPHLGTHAEMLRRLLLNKKVDPILHSCDLRSPTEVRKLLETVRPDECYHLAAVHYSSQATEEERLAVERDLYDMNVNSTLNLLSAIRSVTKETRFVLAGSCLMFEAATDSPQSEITPYATNSIYGLSKVAAAKLVTFFRTLHGSHGSTAILYNHESPRRSEMFVTKKIVANLVKIKKGVQTSFELGDLSTVKDWGYAKDYAEAMWRMSQQKAPSDYVLSSGTKHTVQDFLLRAAERLGVNDVLSTIQIRQRPQTPAAVSTAPLIGDSAYARHQLGWTPTVDFDGLVNLMVENEMRGELD